MGASESTTQKIVSQVYMTNDISNKISNYLETNSKFVCRSTQNIQNSIENIVQSESTKKTQTEVENNQSFVDISTLQNKLTNSTIKISGSSDVVIRQENSLTKMINSIQQFDLYSIDNTNIVLNSDADIVNSMMQQATANNDVASSMSAQNDISSQLDSVNQIMQDIEKSKTDEEVQSAMQNLTGIDLTAMLGSVTDALGNIAKNSNTTQESESLTDIKNIISNVFENKNITNVEQVTETMMSCVFTMTNKNTVTNYQENLERYANKFSTESSTLMTNTIDNVNFDISDSTGCLIEQVNTAELQFYLQALTTITKENSFSNTSTSSIASHSVVTNFLEQKTQVSTEQETTNSSSNTIETSNSQTATQTQTETKTQSNIAAVICIIVVVVVVVIVGAPILAKMADKQGGAGNGAMMSPSMTQSLTQ